MTEIVQAAEGIRMVTPPPEPGSAWGSANIYLVGEDPVTMIDTGWDRDSDRDAVVKALAGAPVEAIIITHGHADHAGGAWALRELTGAPVRAHGADLPAIARRFPAREVDRVIETDEVIKAGPYELAMRLFPGHTPGHLCRVIEESGIVFSGDLVTGKGSSLVAPPEGDMSRYMESLRKLAGLGASLLLPGHGPVVHDPERRIGWLINHRELRELRIASYLVDGPKRLNEMAGAVYSGYVHPQMEMAAAWTAWSHLEKLIEEGSVVFEPEGEPNPFERLFTLAPGVKPPF